MQLPWRDAVAAYYRSLFLNATLPGGVLGDVHRAVRHGMDIGDVGLGVRAVVLERVAGQSVQVLAGGRRAVRCSRRRRARYLPRGRDVVARGARSGHCWLAAGPRALAGPGASVARRCGRTAGRARRAASRGRYLAGHRCSPRPCVVLGPLATFLLAARTAGATAPLLRLVPLTLLALLAMALPLNVAGWGPREGAAAWAFGAAGLTAAQGVATAVTYGVLVLAASLPGAVVLVARWVSAGWTGAAAIRSDPGAGSGDGRVADRPYILLSCGMSIDGYLDGATEKRLLLSNDADFDRVDEVRAECDAILVGARTVRRDNPRLLVRSAGPPGRPGRPRAGPVADEGDRDPLRPAGRVRRLLHRRRRREDRLLRDAAVADARDRLGKVATVVDGGQPVDLPRMAEDLHARGVDRLMVEGGGTMHTQFLTADLADELHLVVAPFFVGDSRARRFVSDGQFPWNPDRRATLAEVRQIGDVVLLRYALSPRFEQPEPRRPMFDPPAPRHCPDPGARAAAVPRRLRHHRRVFSFHGLVDGREHLAFGLGDWAGRCGAAPPADRPAGAPAQRVPDRRRVRQPALRLRTAAARGGRAGRARRRLPALPAPGGPGHRPVRQARGVRAAGRRAWTPTRRTSPSATARTSATTPSRRRCCSALGADRIALLSNNPDKAEQLDRLGVTVTERVPTGVHLSPANAGYLAAKARRAAHAARTPAGRMTIAIRVRRRRCSGPWRRGHRTRPGRPAGRRPVGGRVLGWRSPVCSCSSRSARRPAEPAASCGSRWRRCSASPSLLLLPGRARGRIGGRRRPVRLLGLLTILKIIDMGFFAHARPAVRPGARLDASSAPAVDFLIGSVGRSGAIGRSSWPSCWSLAVPVLMALAVRRLTRLVVRHRHRRAPDRRRRSASSGSSAPSSASSSCRACRWPTATRPASPTTIFARWAPTSRDRARLRPAGRRRRVPRHRAAPTCSAALRGKDVVLAFVESYGRVAVEDPVCPPQVDAGARRRRRGGSPRPGSAPAARSSPRRPRAAAAGWPTPRCSPGCGSTTSSATATSSAATG